MEFEINVLDLKRTAVEKVVSLVRQSLSDDYVTDSPQILSVNAAADLAIGRNMRVRITGALIAKITDSISRTHSSTQNFSFLFLTFAPPAHLKGVKRWK